MYSSVSFLENWPTPPSSTYQDTNQTAPPGSTPFRKNQLQMLLAVNPFGIPSLAFEDAFLKMFKKPLNIQQDFGFANLSEMIAHLSDVFTAQVPDETTALLFPDYAQDYILHDARFGRKFCDNSATMLTYMPDPDIQNTLAWLNRDCDFPNDVCLSGETYKEFYFPMIDATITGTRGVLQAMIVSAANPNHIYLNVNSNDLNIIANLTADVRDYFETSPNQIETYLIPQEFIYFGFPCLAYIDEMGTWERSIILGQSSGFRITVESVDFGGRRNVPYFFLRLMPKKFMEVPKQAILVSMMGVCQGEHKWNSFIGSRIRSFSNFKYWLDCVFVENKTPRQSYERVKIKGENELDDPAKKKRKKIIQLPQYEVLICDRNDDYLNLYLDELLMMENLASADEERSTEVSNLRKQFDEILKKTPRPKYDEELQLFEDSDFDEVQSKI